MSSVVLSAAAASGDAGAPSVVTTTTTPAILRSLQNGSDVRGVALEGVPNEPVTLNEEAAYLIGAAFADWLAEKTGEPPESLSIAVGRDPRLSGPALANAMFAGFASRGVGRLIDLGLATTPACFMSTVTPETNYDAGIMLTASHLPFNRNGAKFFTREGGLDKADIADVCARAADAADAAPGGHPVPVPRSAAEDGDGDGSSFSVVSVPGVTHAPFLPTYAAQLRDLIVAGAGIGPRPLEGFSIVVDAGNGSGGFFASEVLEPLGATTRGSRFLDPDGTFPNHSPNPEDAAAMASGVEAVLEAKADLGVVFDTDVDRSAVIDADGKELNRNRLIALLAHIVLREHPGSTIVTDSVTSDGLAAFIEKRGGKHERYMRGYKNVINRGKALDAGGEACHLMIETSGHGAMRENYCLDDGAYLAVKIIIEAVRRKREGSGGVGDAVADLKEAAEEAETRLRLAGAASRDAGAAVLEKLREDVEEGGASEHFPNCTPAPVNHEGLRVRVDEGDGRFGWFLLRQSLHDPVCVLNVESEVEGGALATLEKIDAWFDANAFENVDASAVKAKVAELRGAR